MSWTRKRTTTGLTIAVALALAALGVHLVGEHRRTQIIDHGSPTPAVVTADHDGELEHWYTVSYSVEGVAHTADLRYPWVIDKIPVGRTLTVYADPDRPGQIVTANGYATPVWTPAPGWLAVLAALAAFISLAGHLSRRRASGRTP